MLPGNLSVLINFTASTPDKQKQKKTKSSFHTVKKQATEQLRVIELEDSFKQFFQNKGNAFQGKIDLAIAGADHV